MAAEFSIAISDGVLAASAFYAIYLLKGVNALSQVGFFTIGMAATVGVFRFGLENAHSQLIFAHKTLSWLARVLGMALISVSYCQKSDFQLLYHILLAISIALVIMSQFLSPSLLETFTAIISSGSVVIMLLVSLIDFNAHGVLGAIGYVIAGLVIGVEGHFHGIPNVDLFHYAMFFANIALALGLAKQPTLIYYKKTV
ncbi:uncharacterized protein LOC135496138 [Lineus longissimus]|uniref:uncharacterized protein LOC135496138 n=1 Tax=Lineus longissimus TaxID=88925 RepID=UPI00315DD49C